MGLSQFTNRNHFCRAVLDSVAFQAHELMIAASTAGACAVRAVHAEGPLAQCRLLMQVQADVCGVPVSAHMTTSSSESKCDDGHGDGSKDHGHRMPSEASLGAALAAGVGAGVLAGPEVLHTTPSMGTAATSVCTYRVTTTSLQRAALLHRWQKARRRNARRGDD